MDINDLRSAVTLAGFLLFLALAVRTWRKSRRGEFLDAAELPFTGESDDAIGHQGRNRS